MSGLAGIMIVTVGRGLLTAESYGLGGGIQGSMLSNKMIMDANPVKTASLLQLYVTKHACQLPLAMRP
jgi:hypothetical protein